MSTKTDQLVGTWLHSHEEDTPTERVYRRSDFDFAPSRGRDGYEFRADRTGEYIGIAPQDGATRTTQKWRLRAGSQPGIVLTFPDGQQRVLSLVSLEEDRLVLRQPSGS